MITTVPNMAGAAGRLQSLLDRAVFDKHVVLDAASLRGAHERSGMHVVRNGYLLFANFGVVNINEVPPGFMRSVKNLGLRALRGLTGLVWAYEELAGALPPNRLTSPYAYVVARKIAHRATRGAVA